MHRWWGVRLMALATLVAPTFVLLGATAQPAHAVGFNESATTTYVVDPAAGAVHVTVDVTSTNTTPDRSSGNITTQTYFQGVSVVEPAEAINLRSISDSGAPLAVTTTPAPVSAFVDIELHFASNLFYNQTAVVHLHFDLPNGAPRSKSFTRVTPAYASFGAFPNGYGGAASVIIVVPRSFTVDLVGDPMTKRATGATVTYTANAIAYPAGWYVSVSARDDSKLVSRNTIVDSHQVRIRAFPDDPAWGQFVDGRVTKGLPVLERLIGLPWTAGNRLEVTETVTPYLYGFAGWYSRRDNTIEIGDALDPQVVLHEMSHMWFNDLLFNTRWIDEGLAQEYAARSVAAMGGKLVVPKAVNLRTPAATPLETWSAVNLQAQDTQAREVFGYNASWFVIHRLTNEIGLAGMRRVIAAASKETLPYLGTDNPEAAGGAGSWKRFLDYLDETGRSKTADALFVKYVARHDDNSIANRKVARAAYARLVAAGHGWKAPLVVRQTMTNWDFSTAESMITAATALTATHDAIEHTVRPLGLHSPATLQADYEYKSSDLGAVQKEATADLGAAKAVVAASGAVNGHHGLFAKIGLIGARDHSQLSQAQRSFTAGDAAGAAAAALATEKTVADAANAGKLRTGAVAGLIVLLLLLGWGLRSRSRRRARKAADPGPESDPSTAVPDPAPDFDLLPRSRPGAEPPNGEVATDFGG